MAADTSGLGFSTQEVRDLKMVYDVFDVGKRGSVENEEIRKALRLLGFKVSRKTVQQMARDVDLPGLKSRSTRGQTDFEGFLQIVSKLQGTSYDKHGEIVQAFEYLDSDGDGMVSLADLKAANIKCFKKGEGLSQVEMQAMLHEADSDGDGVVSREEFVAVLMKTNLFK